MVKFESIVFNKKNETSKQIYSFILKESKINIIHSQNFNDLQYLIQLSLGLYKPKLGNLIYDNLDFLKLNRTNKESFLKQNTNFISNFCDYQQDMTINQYLSEILRCLNFSKDEIQNKINELINQFELAESENIKIKNLNDSQKIRILVLGAKINNPKYLFINNIEKLFINHTNIKLFFSLIKKYFCKNITIGFFTNEKIWKYFKKQDFNFELNVIDLENHNGINEIFYVRDNKNERFQNKKQLPKLNFFTFFLKMFFTNNWVSYIIWYVISLTFLIFLFFSFSNYSISNVLENFNEKRSFIFPKISFELLAIFSNLIFCYAICHLFYWKNIQRFHFWLKKGLGLIEFFIIYGIFIMLCWLSNVCLLITIEIILEFVYNINFNWVFLTVFLFVLLFTYLLFSILITFGYNKKALNFNDELI